MIRGPQDAKGGIPRDPNGKAICSYNLNNSPKQGNKYLQVPKCGTFIDFKGTKELAKGYIEFINGQG